jgi:FlaA1/EpsC-like NDP-sugar epimerase/UDP-N-acetylmuramyl pentapeptide phosphotransferase/UDP-N-acetylglucosamine-1-phosphate transferase
MIGTAAGIAFAVALCATPLLVVVAYRWGLLDHPNVRSSHERVTPRGGGLAVVLAVAAVLAWSGAGEPLLYAILGGALVLAMLGLWDDRFGLSPWIRLAFHVAAAAAVAVPAAGLERLPLPAPFDVPTGVFAIPLAVLWIVAVVNFYNFLDGIDGLAGAQAAVTGLGIAFAAWHASASVMGAALAGGAAGFLIYNWSPARIFLGDVGSGFLGFAFAALPFLAPAEERPRAVAFVGTSLWIFLADATWTLLRRYFRGERLHEAHRDHLYQHLVRSGLSHRVVSAGLAAASALLTVLAVVGWRTASALWAWAALATAILLFTVEVVLVRKRSGAGSSLSDAARLMERGVHVRLAGWRRYLLILALDFVGISASFYLGYFVRFEGNIPAASLQQYRDYLPVLLAIRIPLHLLFGLHRWSFRFSGLQEAMRLVMTSLSGTALFVAYFYFQGRAAEDIAIGSPRAVLLIEFFISTSLMGAIRFSPRLAHAWVLDARRARAGERARTIIVGAGSAGDLLLRDLVRSDEHGYEVVGFVDDDRTKWGTSIGGKPVLGPLSKLAEAAERRQVEQLLFAIPRLPAAKLRDVLSSCADLKLKYKILPVSFAYLNDRVAATMLHDLAPEDLLPRNPTQFDQEGLGRQIQGRRIVVTGAGGSIGGEICRQLAPYRPGRLVLADINENETYFLYRRLQQEHPQLDVVAEIVDIRDAARLQQLGEQHRPQYVFHAAAHKHVPLMEEAPEEAVKNNIVGSMNVIAMAEAAGVERFVLISTDKAVNPSSVMGATKRIAELLVAERVRAGRTGFSAVRFGNVLGSAGSVVPLFKEQIAAGGPVTVTHPDCRRYLMTIPEAVGLVLAAGLGGHGGLCILEMGEPIRILDLARHMITMSGLVPDEDIKIEFTGLRPGERLDEELMTAEEAKTSRMVVDRIRVVETTRPPADLQKALAELERLAARGDRAGVLRAIGDLVPNYQPVQLDAASA